MRNCCYIHRWTVAIFAISISLLLGGCGGGARSDPHPTTGQIPVVAHVFVLVEENHAYEDVIGNPAMSYTNTLAQQNALATQYFADRHNSLPNYFMLTLGDLVTTNDLFAGPVKSNTIVDALGTAGKTWKIYAESLPSVGYVGDSIVPYAKDHNPFAYFTTVLNSSAQKANIVPLTQLPTDLQNGTLPDYAMIVPDLANDGHDCPGESSTCTDTDKLMNIDQWISAHIGPLINNGVMQDSVLIYTWDESNINDLTNGGGHVATILIGGKVRMGFKSTNMYQHQSTLKLTLQLLGISDFPGAAATAPDMTEFF